MKYYFLALALLVSHHASACRVIQWNTEEQYQQADSVFVGYITSVTAPELETAASKSILNHPYTANSFGFRGSLSMFIGQTTAYTVRVVPFVPFKSLTPLDKPMDVTVRVGCSNNDTPEVDAIGLFYARFNTEKRVYEAEFIQKNAPNTREEGFEQQVNKAIHASHTLQ
ncbi:MAG: hypothetical protein ACRCV6_07080 [Formosimonas sp.]